MRPAKFFKRKDKLTDGLAKNKKISSTKDVLKEASTLGILANELTPPVGNENLKDRSFDLEF